MTMTIDGIGGLSRLAGQHLGYSKWRQVTQEQVNLFADATDDHQWIHVDAERARRESPYGATIAHGFLTLSLLPKIVSDAIQLSDLRMAVNYGSNRVRFPAAVRAGSRIRARIVLQSVRDVEGATDATYAVTIQNEGSEKPCCVAEWLARYYK
jgi:acyl dehydratase